MHVTSAPSGSADRGHRRGPGLDVVEAACHAPSIHNTQPWSWRVRGTSLELYADRARQLVHADPRGRNLAISCGAALHHAQVAARGLGWEPTVVRWPDGIGSDLLARIRLTPRSRTPEDVMLLKTLYERRTDRRRFTSWPVQGERLEQLVAVALAWGADAVVLTDVVDRFKVEHLVSRAHLVQAHDPGLVQEHLSWADHSDADGVPSDLVPSRAGDRPSTRPRFEGGRLDDREQDVTSTDGVVVLCSATDDRTAWVRTGEGLGALWLHAVAHGMSIVPLSQAVEVEATRASLQYDVLLGLTVPQLLVRVGWQAISRDQLPPVPRRPLADVLRD